MRRGLKSWSRPETRNTVSMLAATICSSVASPAARRENRLERGRTARILASLPATGGSIATQSPTAGKSMRCAAWCRSRPETRASQSPSAVRIR